MNTYDAIVVGSGISGGWAAKELCEKGLKTLLLERGRNVEHVKDYTNATKDPWQYELRGASTPDLIRKYPKVRRAGLLWRPVTEFFADETDCPYTEAKPFDW